MNRSSFNDRVANCIAQFREVETRSRELSDSRNPQARRAGPKIRDARAGRRGDTPEG